MSQGKFPKAEELREFFRLLYEFGCPTYVCRDGSRTRDGLVFCYWCDEEIDTPHSEDCPWIFIETHCNPFADAA